MKKYKYRFTIFTPCYNSEKFLDRVYYSVSGQTYRDFEWFIINDASTDNTAKLIEEYQKKANFPIRVITNNSNKMLYYNYNLAFKKALGEFMIVIGHDDEIESFALEKFDYLWRTYDSDNIASIWCRCKDQYGNVIGRAFPKDFVLSDYHTMYEKYIYGAQERFTCTKVRVFKENLFDLDSNRIGEGFLWSDIGLRYKDIFVNDILRTYYIEQENLNALTKRGRKQISQETYIYYVEFLNVYMKHVPKAYVLKLRSHFAANYYGVISERDIFEILHEIKPLISRIILLFLFPFAFTLSRIKK